MEISVFDVIGSVGVAMIIVTYYLIQTARMDPLKPAYSIFNAAGSGLIILSLWFDFNLAAFIVEFFWLAISIYGIIRSKFSH